MRARAGVQRHVAVHGDRELHGVEAVVVPGGFSYGDYLRVGAIARFSPVMESVIRFAGEGGLVPRVRSEDRQRHTRLDARREDGEIVTAGGRGAERHRAGGDGATPPMPN